MDILALCWRLVWISLGEELRRGAQTDNKSISFPLNYLRYCGLRPAPLLAAPFQQHDCCYLKATWLELVRKAMPYENW